MTCLKESLHKECIENFNDMKKCVEGSKNKNQCNHKLGDYFICIDGSIKEILMSSTIDYWSTFINKQILNANRSRSLIVFVLVPFYNLSKDLACASMVEFRIYRVYGEMGVIIDCFEPSIIEVHLYFFFSCLIY